MNITVVVIVSLLIITIILISLKLEKISQKMIKEKQQRRQKAFLSMVQYSKSNELEYNVILMEMLKSLRKSICKQYVENSKPTLIDVINKEEYKIKNDHIYFICEDFEYNSVSGFITLFIDEKEKTCTIKQIYVEEDHRYKGIGTYMLSFIEDYCFSHSIYKIILTHNTTIKVSEMCKQRGYKYINLHLEKTM